MAKAAGIVHGVRWVENTAGINEYLRKDAQLYGALFASAYPAVDYAKGIAPVLTGAYRDSIRVEWDEEGIGLRFFSDDNKAHWIEYGAAHTQRQRVLGRAIETIHV
jgi:hypothetical protein